MISFVQDSLTSLSVQPPFYYTLQLATVLWSASCTALQMATLLHHSTTLVQNEISQQLLDDINGSQWMNPAEFGDSSTSGTMMRLTRL